MFLSVTLCGAFAALSPSPQRANASGRIARGRRHWQRLQAPNLTGKSNRTGFSIFYSRWNIPLNGLLMVRAEHFSQVRTRLAPRHWASHGDTIRTEICRWRPGDCAGRHYTAHRPDAADALDPHTNIRCRGVEIVADELSPIDSGRTPERAIEAPLIQPSVETIRTVLVLGLRRHQSA